MNLIIDIGNTCVKLVCFDGDRLVEERRSDKDDTAALAAFCRSHRFSSGIYSAVADISAKYLAALSSLPFAVMEFRSGVTPVPVANRYATPLTLGADRLAAAVAADAMQPGRDILIVDIGTCITADIVSGGAYLGGNISPGPAMRFKALHEHTARLPMVNSRGDRPDFGHDTETAIRSGVINGIKYEIEGYIRYFMDKYPRLFVYLTGGVHLDLQFSEKFSIFADDFLVPKGLNAILEYNTGGNRQA